MGRLSVADHSGRLNVTWSLHGVRSCGWSHCCQPHLPHRGHPVRIHDAPNIPPNSLALAPNGYSLSKAELKFRNEALTSDIAGGTAWCVNQSAPFVDAELN